MIARLFAMLALPALVVVACSGSVLPTVSPSATPVSVDCWVAARGTYRVELESGSPMERELQAVVQIVGARLAAADLAESDVRPEPPDSVLVRIGQTDRMDDVRSLITSRGAVEFVPVPTGQDVEVADRLDPSWAPLFGREGVAQARPETDEVAQPVIALTLTADAAQKLDDWAEHNAGSQLAIAVDGIVVLAPVIQSGNFGGRMTLSGPNDQGRGPLLALLSQPQLPVELAEVSFSEQPPPSGCLAP